MRKYLNIRKKIVKYMLYFFIMKIAFVAESIKENNRVKCDGKCINFETCFNCMNNYIHSIEIVALNKDGTKRQKNAKIINLSQYKKIYNQHKITDFFKK